MAYFYTHFYALILFVYVEKELLGKDNLIFLPKEEVRIVNKCVLC